MKKGSRRMARRVRVGNLILGGGEPIRVQSMTNTDTADVPATLAQIERLVEEGCELVRVAVSGRNELSSFASIRERVEVPLIADIQFNHRLALECLREGADKVRINPGNMGSKKNVQTVFEEAGRLDKAVRIGINSGSIDETILARHGGPTPQAMLDSAKKAIAAADEVGFHNLVLSIKSSGVMQTVEACRMAALETDYPFHLGVTEAGTILTGSVKSAVGLGILLHEGLGDTIRVSLTGPPEMEIGVAYQILRAISLRQRGPEIVSCPTCSRCKIDIISMVEEVERRLSHVDASLTVAVMGCHVNGPGEARMADIGLAGGPKKGAIFRKGTIIRRVPEKDCVDALMAEIDKLLAEEK